MLRPRLTPSRRERTGPLMIRSQRNVPASLPVLGNPSSVSATPEPSAGLAVPATAARLTAMPRRPSLLFLLLCVALAGLAAARSPGAARGPRPAAAVDYALLIRR